MVIPENCPREMLQFEKLGLLIPGSSMVEHSAVNRRVASSNLARGANLLLNSQIVTRNLRFLKAWNTWNNFGGFRLRQLETKSDTLRNFRTEFRIFLHLDVFVGDGAFHRFTITRFGVSGPIFHEGMRHVA